MLVGLHFLLIFALLRKGSFQPIPTCELYSSDGLFHLYVLPVGQGSAMIVRCPDETLSVFDMGTCSSRGDEFWNATDIKEFLGPSINRVKNIIVTHNNVDHYNLLDKVFQQTDDLSGLTDIYISRTWNEMDKSLQKWITDIDATEKLRTFNSGNRCGAIGFPDCQSITLCPGNSRISAQVLSANAGETYVNGRPNVDSIVVGITYDSFKLQLNGDFENATSRKRNRDGTDFYKGPLQDMVDKYGSELQTTVYMLAHHGADTCANKKVIRDAVKPKAIFSSSDPWFRKKQFAHPRCSVIDAFTETTLCKLDSSDSRYCGRHPISRLPLQDKLQNSFTCGVKKYVTEKRENDGFAIYTTRPNETHINLIHLLTDGTDWGFCNNYETAKYRGTNSEMPEEVHGCYEEDTWCSEE